MELYAVNDPEGKDLPYFGEVNFNIDEEMGLDLNSQELFDVLF